MERSERTLVPGWLKNSGSGTGGGTNAPSSSQSDDNGVSKPARNKSSVNDQGSVSLPGSDRTTSSYLRRNSSRNGSAHSRSYSSFGRSQRDRGWDKEIYEYRDKEKSVFSDYRHRDYSDPLGNILPSRFEKDRLRRSQSSISAKRGEPWPRRVAADSINANKNNHSNGNLVVRSVHKTSFERDFPSLGAEERQVDPETKRVPSPVLSSTIQSLPIGSSAVIGGDGWTSALAEVPVIVGSNGTSASLIATSASSLASAASSTAPAPAPAPAPVASSPTTGLNMAETLAQGPSRVQTAPQLAVGTQRLEEIALRQSRQLIPVTPSVPKALVLNTSDKSKPKVGPQQHQIPSPHHINHSPRAGPLKPDVSKTSSIGKLHILKPARERNGISPAPKDNNSSSPTNATKSANSPRIVAPSVVGTAPLRSLGSNPVVAKVDRKPALMVLEKRPTPQAQSRHDFFNLMRKKSTTNSSSATPDPSPAVSPSVLDKQTEAASECAISTHDRDDLVPDRSGGAQLSDGTHSGDDCDGSKKYLNNGKNHSRFEVILYPEEEEVSFLRSLGWPWEENFGEDEGLTEEEINAFRSKVIYLLENTKNFDFGEKVCVCQLVMFNAILCISN
ncbi:hypothetical protein LguiB_006811 [Lonicera macranthoides]